MSITTSTAILNRAGLNVSPAVSGAMLNEITSGAIATINNITRINYSNTYTTLNNDVKTILNEVASKLGAIDCITYDMSGYTSRIEAEDMINVLRDGVLRGLSLLRDKKTTDFIDGA